MFQLERSTLGDLQSLRVPDLWQQEAIRGLQEGRDVVVDAPTGAGKTYIFELLIKGGWRGQAIYTVPTRALANDKLLEWQRQGWNVGIATGDIAENLTAPVIVATLETQKRRLLEGQGPSLLVVDEYQMLADSARGVNYEMAIATAPSTTQLLLLSGSVGNPGLVVEWLQRLGRQAVLVAHRERPVPLEEVNLEALPDRGIPASVRGLWPRAIAKALKHGMAPLLAFAPRRRAAEDLARQLMRMLPEEDPLRLTPEQEILAGPELTKLLRARIAYHHSGLDYRQRAGLVEPLAKAGQLRVVVATMGLSAGINFSMRSVIVTDREYRHGDRTQLVRPDELLQMFGRAGRRGIDKRGYVLVAPGKPRWSEAQPLRMQSTGQLDWPSLLSVMQTAQESGNSPTETAEALVARMLRPQAHDLGLRTFRPRSATASELETQVKRQRVVEIQTPDGGWERKRAPHKRPLGEAIIFHRGSWKPALAAPETIFGVPVGTLCRLGDGDEALYGREVPLARYGQDDAEGDLVLTRWAWQVFREHGRPGRSQPPRRQGWTLERLERELLPLLPAASFGGRVLELIDRGKSIVARLGYDQALAFAHLDRAGRALILPPEREVELEAHLGVIAAGPAPARGDFSPATAWYQLGLIDERARPTQRGVLFSFFNHGEGLAIAAALEDPTYPIEELIFDIANLRAGYRFSAHEAYSGRLGNVCRATYRGATIGHYLRKGVPPEYGDGAAEILARLAREAARKQDLLNDELLSGDIERARLEWRSLLTQIAHAPDLDWERWLELRLAARDLVYSFPPQGAYLDFPPLTAEQRQRHKSFLRFD